MRLFSFIIIYCTFFYANENQAQTIDTLVDVGNHSIHFHIVKGTGIPILFEPGAESDATVWNSLLKPVAEITRTTLITYDRAGFGKSTIDTTEKDISKHGIVSNVNDLEIGLKKLGYDKQIILVSHSYGGYLSTLFSVRHPDLVKSIVLIDVCHDFYFKERYLKKAIKEEEKVLLKLKKTNLALYYLHASFEGAIETMKELSIPRSIPVMDFVCGIPFKKNDEADFWKECHKRFVESHPNSIGITAHGCGHGIWMDNPSLIITSISKAYADSLEEIEKMDVYQRALNYALATLNKVK